MEKRKLIYIVLVIVVLVSAYLISTSNREDNADLLSEVTSKEYEPSTECEILAYNAFMDRFGESDDMQITGMSTSETSYDKIKNNSYEEYSVHKDVKDMNEINESDYAKFLDVEVEFLIDENTGNLMAGRNTHSYYIGLNKDGKYVVVGESLLG